MKIFKIFFLSVLIISCMSITSSKDEINLETLTPTELLAMPKVTDYILSPDGQYLIYGVKKWNPDTGKSYSHFRFKNLKTNETKILTPKIEGQSDSSPQFSSAFPNFLFFQRSNSEIKSSIYYIKFPPENEIKDDEDLSIRLSTIISLYLLIVFLFWSDFVFI